MDFSDRSKRWVGFSVTVNKNATTEFFIKCPGSMSYNAGPMFQNSMTNDRLVWGAEAWGENIVNGDYVQMDVVDHENILGAGIDYVLKSFCETATVSVYPSSGTNEVHLINGMYIHPTEPLRINNPIHSRLYGGMWLRFKYISVGTVNDPKIFVNLNWDKQNT